MVSAGSGVRVPGPGPGSGSGVQEKPRGFRGRSRGVSRVDLDPLGDPRPGLLVDPYRRRPRTPSGTPDPAPWSSFPGPGTPRTPFPAVLGPLTERSAPTPCHGDPPTLACESGAENGRKRGAENGAENRDPRTRGRGPLVDPLGDPGPRPGGRPETVRILLL